MHQALYRKWRPSTFDEVVGQEHITSVLKYEIEKSTFNHAYLFCGSRGTGKTTCAKILAKAVNCESPTNGSPCGKCPSCRSIELGSATDVLEMDAASNNGVDNIRDIRDEVVYTPSQLKYRVYIVDEVHMLSGNAFNALLKTLEEPPEHVIFILATTELYKLPATIISRCQRFDFRRITVPVLTERLLKISSAEGFNITPEAARLIAKLAQGGMRDAISLLDLCSGSGRDITLELIEECSGIMGRGTMIDTVKALSAKNYDVIFDIISQILSSSKDIAVFWQDLVSLYRDMLVIKTTRLAKNYLDLTEAEEKELSELAAKFTKETLLSHCKLLDAAYHTMQRANASKRVIAELTLIRMCDETLDTSNEAILSRLSRLEDSIRFGSFATHSGEKAASGIKPADKEETSAPQPEPVAAKPAPRPKERTDTKLSLRPIRSKMEIAEKLMLSDISSASFLKNSNMFETDDQKILIKAPSEFAISMLSRQKTKEALCLALASCLGREFSCPDIKFEAFADSDSDMYDIIDDLMDN